MKSLKYSLARVAPQMKSCVVMAINAMASRMRIKIDVKV